MWLLMRTFANNCCLKAPKGNKLAAAQVTINIFGVGQERKNKK